MSSKPRATIILACHNVEDFIVEALDSIIAQSTFSELEVFVVDDGSTDSTREIILDYASRFENIEPIVFDVASGGPGKPRNAGLDRATSDIVIFMDPDDRIHEDGYTTLIETMERHDSDLVIATRYGVPEHAPAEQRQWTDYLVPDEIYNDGSYALKLDLLERRPVILKTAYRRSLIEEHGLRFIEGITTSEDEIFDMKMILLSDRITKINDVVYLYTVARTGSVTSKIRLKIYEDLDAVFAGLDDALSTYFGDAIVSYRLAGLVRSFYLPKLLLLDPDETDAAIELIYAACERHGFDRLLLTENSGDHRIIELLQERNFSQLMLFFMNQRNSHASYLVRQKNNQIRSLRRSMRRKAIRFPNAAARRWGRVKRVYRHFRHGHLRQYLTANRAEGGFEQSSNGYWVFMDRRDKGSDNGEALYRYVRDEGIHDRIAFVIRDDCPDFERLSADGFNVVPYNSIEHWELLYRAEFLITSHCDDVIIYPWLSFGKAIKKPRYRLAFLQHGIIRSDLSGWLGTKKYALFCASTAPEYDSLLNNIRYRLTPDNLKLTGLARHDLLVDEPEDYVLVFPTWRSFLQRATPERFVASEFFQAWSQVAADPHLRDRLSSAGLKIKFVLHSSLNDYREEFESDDVVQVLSFDEIDDFSRLISGAKAMVTDYSTISFDLLYLRRPVLYYTFPESQQHSTNVGANLALYDRVGWRVESMLALRTAVDDLVSSDWQVDDSRRSEIDRFFAHHDRNNRQRIVDELQKIREN